MPTTLTKFSGYATLLNQVVVTTGALLGRPVDGPFPGVWATVYDHNATTLATLYDAQNQLAGNPFEVNTDGGWTFYGPSSSYDIIFTTSVPTGKLVPDVQVQTYASTTALPAANAQLPGRLARVALGGGLWMSNGTSWSPIGSQDVVGVVSIAAFGAVGDDATDNTLAIQSAIDTVYANGGGSVYVPNGIFQTGDLILKSGVSLVGDGHGHCLKAKNGLNDSWLSGTGTDMGLYRLEIDGNKSHNTTGGAIVLTGIRITVDDCYVHDTPTVGIQIGYPANGAIDRPNDGYFRITNNKCKNCGTNGYGAIAVTHGQHVIISGNECAADDGKQTYGIDIEPNVGNLMGDVQITNNLIVQGRLYVDCTNITLCTDVRVEENYVYAPGSGADEPLFDNAVPLFLRNLDRLKVTGNTFVGHPDGVRGGIYVGQAISKFQITDNLIFPQQPPAGNGFGISFDSSASIATDGIIANNYLCGIDNVATTFGIFSFSATGWVRVRAYDNTFRNIGQHYGVGSASPTTLVNPIVVNSNYTISPDDGDDVLILANASSGAVTITPYTAANNIGCRVAVIKTDATTHQVIVDPTSTETWSGKTTLPLARQYERAAAYSDGTNWVELVRERSNGIDVRDFGVIGDGTTDDTAAIQLAINAATPGQVVFFPAATYICNRAFVKSGVTLTGTGKGSVLTQSNGNESQILDLVDTTQYYDDVRITYLTFDGNKANNTTRGGVELLGRRNVVSHCTFQNCPQAFTFGGFINGTTNVPLAGSSAFVDNVITNCKAGVLVVHGSNLTISDNVIQNTDGDMATGIALTPNTGNAITDVTLANNVVIGASSGLALDGSGITITEITATGNQVDVRGFTGTVVDSTVPVYLRNVSGLHLSDNMLIGHADGYHGGIYVVGAIDTFRIGSNTILPSAPAVGSSWAIRFANTASIATNGVIGDNTIMGLETVTYGIYTPNASGWSGVESIGNRFRSITIHHYIGQTGLPIGPSQEWTRKSSWNTGVVASGSAVTTTVTFEGAVVGDWVHAAFSNLPAKVFTDATVSAGDTITLSLYNISGGNITFNDAIRLVLRKYTNEPTGVY